MPKQSAAAVAHGAFRTIKLIPGRRDGNIAVALGAERRIAAGDTTASICPPIIRIVWTIAYHRQMGRFLSAVLAILLAKLRALSRVMTDDLACATVDTEAVVAKCMLCLPADLTGAAIPNMRLRFTAVGAKMECIIAHSPMMSLVAHLTAADAFAAVPAVTMLSAFEFPK